LEGATEPEDEEQDVALDAEAVVTVESIEEHMDWLLLCMAEHLKLKGRALITPGAKSAGVQTAKYFVALLKMLEQDDHPADITKELITGLTNKQKSMLYFNVSAQHRAEETEAAAAEPSSGKKGKKRVSEGGGGGSKKKRRVSGGAAEGEAVSSETEARQEEGREAQTAAQRKAAANAESLLHSSFDHESE